MSIIAVFRKLKDMNQSDIAKFLGVSQSTVAMWETGKSMPRAEMLPKLAECLGCTVDELLKKEVRNEET